MAFVKKRKFALGVLVIILIIIVAFGVFTLVKKYKADNQKRLNTSTGKLPESIQTQITNEEKAYIKDPQTISIYESLKDKNYDEVIKKAGPYCPSLTGKTQLNCYGLYAQALEEKNLLEELTKVAQDVLKTEAINTDETAKNIWNFILENAKKGINPKDIKMDDSDIEARS